MREVMRGFRLKIRAMEEEAKVEIEKAFGGPTLDPVELTKRNQVIISIVAAKMKKAMAEGGRFGEFIAKKT